VLQEFEEGRARGKERLVCCAGSRAALGMAEAKFELVVYIVSHDHTMALYLPIIQSSMKNTS
jgi:hypothetical protein